MGKEGYCKQISLVCVGSAHSVSATLVLPPLTACVLSQSTLLRLQVALQGNFLRLALGCVEFPGLSHSGSASCVLQKGVDSIGPVFCALPRSEHLRRPGAWRAHSPQVGGTSYHLPYPSRSVSWVRSKRSFSGVSCVSPGKLISDCNPRKPAHSLVEDAVSGDSHFLALVAACLSLCLWLGMGWSAAGQLSSGVRSVLCSVSRPGRAFG